MKTVVKDEVILWSGQSYYDDDVEDEPEFRMNWRVRRELRKADENVAKMFTIKTLNAQLIV